MVVSSDNASGGNAKVFLCNSKTNWVVGVNSVVSCVTTSCGVLYGPVWSENRVWSSVWPVLLEFGKQCCRRSSL